MTHTRKNLLALPVRQWDDVKTYASIALIPTGKKHDSGYSLIAIIGFDKVHGEPVEIAAYCDDVCYSFPEGLPANPINSPVLRTDMFYPSGITHVWARHYRFKVGACYGSTEIALIPKENT